MEKKRKASDVCDLKHELSADSRFSVNDCIIYSKNKKVFHFLTDRSE